MWRSCFFILFFAFSIALPAKDIQGKSNTYTVYINYEEYSVRANVLQQAGKIHPKTGYTYYWYSNNDIKKTDGSYDGKLLHGEYKSFYRDLNLKEQGNFSHGLKTGKWMTWYAGGKIHEIVYYRNGEQHGVYELYDEKGNRVTRSGFKNGRLNGPTIISQNGKSDSVIHYKNGKVISSKSPAGPKPTKKMKEKNLASKSKNESGSQGTTVVPPKSRFSLKKVLNKTKKENTSKEAATDSPKGGKSKKKYFQKKGDATKDSNMKKKKAKPDPKKQTAH